MDVLILTIFVSLILAALGVGLFVWSARAGTGEHADRLALLPLEREHTSASKTPATPDQESNDRHL
jgi:cbb3-type cytochrome oxidase maturation protein